ncbi:MAG: hypothetical protein KGI49_03000 [Patescibacteria group bacterium]|nr:hypothetical protein [Patescibacteria group bacterium]
METKFQTSFIPKKTMPTVSISGSMSGRPQHRSGFGSIFMSIAVLMFLASLLAVGGAYAWKQYLVSTQDNLKQELSIREQQFNIDLIEQLKAESTKISIAKQILSNHLAMSKIFGIIAALTAENVRFTGMDVTAPASPGGDIGVSLSGYGKDLSAVAFQSDVLGQLDQYGLRKIVKNPILSNPTLDQAGTVSFGLTASIDPSALSYSSEFQQSGASSTPQSVPQQ